MTKSRGVTVIPKSGDLVPLKPAALLPQLVAMKTSLSPRGEALLSKIEDTVKAQRQAAKLQVETAKLQRLTASLQYELMLAKREAAEERRERAELDWKEKRDLTRELSALRRAICWLEENPEPLFPDNIYESKHFEAKRIVAQYGDAASHVAGLNIYELKRWKEGGEAAWFEIKAEIRRQLKSPPKQKLLKAPPKQKRLKPAA
jgi:hypothetical protein